MERALLKAMKIMNTDKKETAVVETRFLPMSWEGTTCNY